MNLSVQRELLLKPLQAISSVVEKKQTQPILSNVLLTTKDNRLLLTGTDLEIELISFVPIETLEAEGTLTVSARKLFDICRALPENTIIQLIAVNHSCIVRAGQSSFTLNTMPAKDFPDLEDTTYPIQFRLKQTALKNLLTNTYFAMAHQDVRHYLNGTCLDIAAKKIKCIAADGHRLALSTQKVDSGDIETRIILPRKSVLELMRLLTNDDEIEADVYINEHRFRLITSGLIFTTKLISAQYPDYNRLIPKGGLIATGEREVIKQALTRAAILSNEKFRGVRLQLESNSLRITANNADQEQAEEALPLKYDGNKMELGFNIAYLLDIVSAITADFIRCAFTDTSSGVLIEAGNEQGETMGDSLYVVMPMRL